MRGPLGPPWTSQTRLYSIHEILKSKSSRYISWHATVVRKRTKESSSAPFGADARVRQTKFKDRALIFGRDDASLIQLHVVRFIVLEYSYEKYWLLCSQKTCYPFPIHSFPVSPTFTSIFSLIMGDKKEKKESKSPKTPKSEKKASVSDGDGVHGASQAHVLALLSYSPLIHVCLPWFTLILSILHGFVIIPWWSPCASSVSPKRAPHLFSPRIRPAATSLRRRPPIPSLDVLPTTQLMHQA